MTGHLTSSLVARGYDASHRAIGGDTHPTHCMMPELGQIRDVRMARSRREMPSYRANLRLLQRAISTLLAVKS